MAARISATSARIAAAAARRQAAFRSPGTPARSMAAWRARAAIERQCDSRFVAGAGLAVVDAVAMGVSERVRGSNDCTILEARPHLSHW
ncbi:MAG: hypothetical protein ACKOWG_07975, partial [Planctomycetia bacterium]